MKTRFLMSLVVLLALIACTPVAFAQQMQQKMVLGATPIAQKEMKFTEVLTTREGQQIPPGVYRVAVTLNSMGEAQFVISVPTTGPGTTKLSGVTSNALNVKKIPPASVTISGIVDRNLLIRGIASNIRGDFSVQPMTPSESILMFNSKQFRAHAILGRDVNTKLVDLRPVFLALDEPSTCGAECIEGLVKVTIRNQGNAEAKGKWNVILADPQFFVGTVENIPPGADRIVVSATKLQLPCCAPLNIHAEVHADFYNKDGADSNDANNSQPFNLKLK